MAIHRLYYYESDGANRRNIGFEEIEKETKTKYILKGIDKPVYKQYMVGFMREYATTYDEALMIAIKSIKLSLQEQAIFLERFVKRVRMLTDKLNEFESALVEVQDGNTNLNV